MMEYRYLPNGLKMPILGLGTWLADDEEELTSAMENALEMGYRHFDTAYMYFNESIIGKVLKKWLTAGKIQRKELFIVTKLPVCAMVPEKVGNFLNKSLESLQLDYVDLYLVHAPFGLDSKSDADPIPMQDGEVVIDKSTNLEAVWKAMESQVNGGKAKAIGISNFDEGQVERIVKVAKIPPASLQVELHAYFQQRSLRAICAKHEINVTAFGPLGSGGRKNFYEKVGLNFEPTTILINHDVEEIAKRYEKTPAQILLRFLVQQGITVIPKSTNANRMKENFQVFDFHLNSKEMEKLSSLDQGPQGRIFGFQFLPGIEKHPEFPKGMRE